MLVSLKKEFANLAPAVELAIGAHLTGFIVRNSQDEILFRKLLAKVPKLSGNVVRLTVCDEVQPRFDLSRRAAGSSSDASTLLDVLDLTGSSTVENDQVFNYLCDNCNAEFRMLFDNR